MPRGELGARRTELLILWGPWPQALTEVGYKSHGAFRGPEMTAINVAIMAFTIAKAKQVADLDYSFDLCLFLTAC